MGAYPCAGAAAYAKLLFHKRLPIAVLLHFAGPGAAAHAKVLHSPAKACRLMPLKVGKGDDNISIHNRLANLGLFHIFKVYGHDRLVGALEPIGDYDMAAGLQR